MQTDPVYKEGDLLYRYDGKKTCLVIYNHGIWKEIKDPSQLYVSHPIDAYNKREEIIYVD